MSARRPVWVRGVGAVTPLGDTWEASALRLAAGETAVRAVTGFDVTGFPCTAAAAIDPAHDETPWEDRRRDLCLRAARAAWERSDCRCDPARVGVFLGAESGRGSFRTVFELAQAAGGGARFDHRAFGVNARTIADRIDASVISPSAVAAQLADRIGAHGPVETVCLACASGLAAIIEGVRAIRLGRCDVALCGGVGADVDPLMLVGFGLLGALSARGVSRPFDAHRDGFVVGEGAAMVVLTRERGDANVAVTGVGRSLDAWHLTAPDPQGDGAFRAMTAALDDARRPPIGYVQAHGTSTPLNDAVEAKAIRRALGDDVARTRVASVKGAVGHWIAGAGAVGCLCAVEAVARGVVLPTAGLREPDPACDLPHVMGKAEHADVTAAMVNAFAFGGANSSAIVAREEV
jgi:3-oxoacyl-[acyl-carrier-protein] synthase II